MINVRNLSKRYGRSLVVNDVTLELRDGGLTAIVGANGAGKSTLLSMIARLLEADGGSISVGDLDVATAADLTKMLGFEPAVIQAGAGTEAAVTQHRARQEWTEWVLVLLLLAAVGESAWAWVCGRAW